MRPWRRRVMTQAAGSAKPVLERRAAVQHTELTTPTPGAGRLGRGDYRDPGTRAPDAAALDTGARLSGPPDCRRRALWVRTVAVLHVRRDRQVAGGRERGDVDHDLVQRDAPVHPSQGEGEAGARGGERLEAMSLEHPGRPGIPRVGDDERLRRVQRCKGGSLRGLRAHGWTSNTSSGCLPCITSDQSWIERALAYLGSSRRKRSGFAFRATASS